MPSIHDETYKALLRHILENGEGHDDRTKVGTISVFGYQCRFDLSKGFPLLTTKKMAWKSMVNELVWFLRGRTDNKFLLDRKCTIWNEWATKEQCEKFRREEGDLGPVYGHQWRRFGGAPLLIMKDAQGQDYPWRARLDGVDQIKVLSDDLMKNPGSRRLIVTGWNPYEATQVALPPCHTLWQCKVRKDPTGATRGILDLQLYQRSADSFLGVPFNISSYALLLTLLAETHGFKPGVFVHTFGDLHIYNNHVDQVQQLLDNEPFEAPTVKISERLIGKGFDGLMDFDLEHVQLLDYQSHDAIKAPVAV
jgi:thymidylate synthase